MDPLSVTASVVGLLAAAGQAISVLSKIKSSVSDAPSSIEQILSHVTELQTCFAAVHKFVIGATLVTPASQRRLSMIEVDQLVATLTESVLTFSELEALVTPFRKCDQARMRNRIEWAWKEDIVSRIMLRLDRHKSALLLMLNIIQCESDREAEQSQQSLLLLVQQLVESNAEISRRLKKLETKPETESILTVCFRNGNSVEVGESEEATTGPPREISQRPNSVILDSSSSGFPATIFPSAFEDDLNDSRVYKRTQPYECDVSFTSSAVRSHSWSVFSGLSLSQISSLSVIALPVYLHEISNKELYGFVFFDQPNSQGTSLPTTISEEIREEEEEEEENFSDDIFENDSDFQSDETITLSKGATSHSGQAILDPWLPQVTPAERLFYFNTITGETSPELPLEFSSSGIQNQTEDPLNFKISAESRPPLEIMARNNTEDEKNESDRSSVSEEVGERFALTSMDPQQSNTGVSTNLVFQPVKTNASKSRRYFAFPVIPQPVEKMALYKLVVLGDGGVGKTELVIQLTLQHFVESYDPGIEDSYRKQVVIDGQNCILEVLDTAGQEEYTALRDQWIRDGEGFILVYSITSRSSFTRIPRFYNQVQRVKESSASSPSYQGSPLTPERYNPEKLPPIMLVGNNSERVTEREVSTKEGFDLAQELGCDFIETSVANCINVEKAFYDVVRKLRRERKDNEERAWAAFRERNQSQYAPRKYRQPPKRAGGVSQVWQKVRAKAS